MRAEGPILLGSFDDQSGFGINLRRPAGVRYFDPKAFAVASRLVTKVNLYAYLNDTPLRDSTEKEVSLALDIRPGPSSTSSEMGSRQSRRVLSTWIHISNGCNMACRYCYIPGLRKGLVGDRVEKFVMSSETTGRTVDTLFAICQRNGFSDLQLKFAGGEPTLAPEVIVAACVRAEELTLETGVQPHFRILTNGVFDHDRIVPIFSRFNFGVSISVDGDPEAHNSVRFVSRRKPDMINSLPIVRGRTGTWEIVASTVDSLIEVGIKPFLLCTVTRNNYRHLRGMITYCRERRIGFRLSPVRDATTCMIPHFQRELASELVALYAWIAETYPPMMPIERFAGFAEWNLRRKKTGACGSCKSMVGVRQDGALASCQMRLDDPISAVEDDDAIDFLQMIASHDDYGLISRPDSRSGSCVECDFESTCAGGCPEHTRLALGTVNAVSPWCDLYTKVLPGYVQAIAMQVKRAVVPASTLTQINPQLGGCGSR